MVSEDGLWSLEIICSDFWSLSFVTQRAWTMKVQFGMSWYKSPGFSMYGGRQPQRLKMWWYLQSIFEMLSCLRKWTGVVPGIFRKNMFDKNRDLWSRSFQISSRIHDERGRFDLINRAKQWFAVSSASILHPRLRRKCLGHQQIGGLQLSTGKWGVGKGKNGTWSLLL